MNSVQSRQKNRQSQCQVKLKDMKQTPIQKLIEWLDKDPRGMLHAYDKQIITEYAQSLLPYERKCIEGAYKEGEAGFHYCAETAQDYFSSTYNNPQGGGVK